MKRAGRKQTMNCRKIAEHLSDYLDGELDASLRRVIEAHGGECPPCRALIRTLALTVEAIRAQPQQPLPSSLKSSLAAALRKLGA